VEANDAIQKVLAGVDNRLEQSSFAVTQLSELTYVVIVMAVS
jgi:hypothetical protein